MSFVCLLPVQQLIFYSKINCDHCCIFKNIDGCDRQTINYAVSQKLTNKPLRDKYSSTVMGSYVLTDMAVERTQQAV